MRLPALALIAAGFVLSVGSAHAFTQDNVTNRAADGGARFADDDAASKWGGGFSVNGQKVNAANDEAPAGTYANVERRAFNKTGYFEPIILLPAKPQQ